MSAITLGNFEFDPLEPTDFRLTVEGASNTGKSNTLAVLLEDLAETHVPTLIIERLGILSPVRKIDENLIVVGARDEQGIDLAVPIDQLDVVAEMVLEEGLKVLLDISTYADVEADKHTEHLATARVLSALDNLATERLRAGSRRKCLLFVDEVHYLAPESGAPHIEADEYVKRARGQLVTVFTEGGNKGIIPTVAFQRQAYTSKGVVSQADNRIIHRLHATDRKNTASEIGIGAEEIEQLGTGEVLIYGDFTSQRVVGPEQVRRRLSPDPREESFELPEPPEELSDTLASIAGDVEQREQESRERRDRIEKLEAEVERLQERNEELRSDRETGQRIAETLERFAGDGDAGAPTELVTELEDLRDRNEDLQNDIEDLRAENETLHDRLEEKVEEIQRLQGELAELEEFEVIRDELTANAQSILRLLGESDPDAEEAREQIDEIRDEKRALEERVDELQDELDRARDRTDRDAGDTGLGDEFEDAMDFLRHEAVQEEVERAARKAGSAEDNVWDVVLALAKVGKATNSEIAPLTDVSESTVRGILPRLAELRIVDSETDGNRSVYSLNTEGLEKIVVQHRQRQEMTEFREQVSEP